MTTLNFDTETGASAPELSESYDLFIDGTFQAAAQSSRFEIVDPSTSETLTQSAQATRADFDKAVTAAGTAYDETWGKLEGNERSRYLYTFAEKLEEHLDELSGIASVSMGIPLNEAKKQVQLLHEHVFYYAGWADKLKFAFPGAEEVYARGVVSSVSGPHSPLFNWGYLMAGVLGTGNTTVIWATEVQALFAIKMAQLVQLADFPAGTINILTASTPPTFAPETISGVDLSLYYGLPENNYPDATSTEKQTENQETIEQPADRVVQSHYCGATCHIVLEDAHIQYAVNGLMRSVKNHLNSLGGGLHHIWVQEARYEALIEEAKRQLNQLVVGNPLNSNSDLGPASGYQIKEQYNLLLEQLTNGQDDLWQAEIDTDAASRNGFYCTPALLSDMHPAGQIYKNKATGPLLSVNTFRQYDEIPGVAGQTGSSCCTIWTSYPDSVKPYLGEVEADRISVNRAVEYPAPGNLPANYYSGGASNTGAGKELYPLVRMAIES